jgi:Response regulator containing CheY-like receiver domain and AraC-type DNA-binding domain
MYKVIIVDDETAVLKGLTTLVDWDSYNFELVHTSLNAFDALKYISNNKIDLLITDVCMPECNGLELIHKAKLIQPQLRIVVISAYDRFEYTKEALKLGAENYLLKPINQEELIQTIKSISVNFENIKLYQSNLEISAFRNSILDRWVNDSIIGYELEDRAKFIGINLNTKQYNVIVFDYPDGYNASKGLNLLNVCIDKARNRFDSNFFIDSHLRIVGVIYSNNDTLTDQLLYDFILAVMNCPHIERDSIFAVTGPFVSSFTEVHTSYKYACRYLFARYLGFSERYIFQNHYIIDEKKYGVLHRKLGLLENTFKQLQQDEITGIIKEVISGRYLSDKPVRDLALICCINLLNSYADIVNMKAFPEEAKNFLTGFACIDKNVLYEEWLTTLTRKLSNMIQEFNNILHPYVKKAIDYIKENYANDISLKTISQHFHVTSAYMGKIFYNETGKYFNDYLCEVRLAKAEDLLTHTELKISDISNKSGFSGQSYFNRLFKNVYNLSPLEYRRKNSTR